ncbi:unnamed protein product [Nezara viridula]|uniref:omega-amidase n=3 Tax=Nezara viridula TaxID=85310 RepID=A0A9P0HHV6_NEZVI|nr:unnamed protein product [Nezara viridula]
MASLTNIRIALIQMTVGKNKLENVARARKMISEAKQKGCNLVVLPECFNSPYGTKYFGEYSEEIPNGETCIALSKAAKENEVFLVGGSIPEKDNGKLFNTCTIWNPQGSLVGKYSKIHLFDIDIPGGVTFKESDSLSPGKNISVIDVGACKIGIGICYDLRFHELATIYKDLGVDLLLYPGAFNMTTGPLHWEHLIKARAVDNQVFAAGICGARDDSADYVAWGHSVLIDPWGKVVSKAGAEETTLIADIDLNVCKAIREQIPIRKQRRTDLYETLYKGKVQEGRKNCVISIRSGL